MVKPPAINTLRYVWRESGVSESTRSIPEEAAVALTYNGGTYAVMMATPQDLELEKIAEHGISAFVAKDMAAAKADFNRILEMKETDQSAKLILQRIADYEAMTDKSAWSAINALVAK